MIRVLVTGAGALLGQGIIKSLRMSSLPCKIIAGDISPLAAGLYRCDKAYLLPKAHDQNFLKELARIVRQEQIEAVFVGTDVELPVVAAHRKTIESDTGTKILVSTPEVVAIADDKWETYLFLKEHGFLYPESCLPAGLRDFLSRVPFPLVVKPRVGARSANMCLVRNQKELEQALATVESPIIQECLLPETEEYTVGALVFDGRCFGVIAMKRELKDGNTYRAFVEDYPTVTNAVQRMAVALNSFGPANFQLRLTVKGPTVFEINARFSGTTPLRVALGFNEVEATLRRVVLGETIEPLTYRKGVVLRYMNEMVVPFEEYQKLAEGGYLDHPRAETLDAF